MTNVQNNITQSYSSGGRNGPLEKNTYNLAKQSEQGTQKVTYGLYEQRKIVQSFMHDHRVRICGQWAISELDVEIWQNDKDRLNYKNLMSCGSIWACPVCRHKLMENKKTILDTALQIAENRGFEIGFLTLTDSHTRSNYKEKVKSVRHTWTKILQSRKFREFMGEDKLRFVRNFEITYSRINSFHPHLHIILLAEVEKERLTEIANKIRELWLWYNKDATAINQVYKPVYNSTELREYLAGYITKTNLSHELTNNKGAKIGKKDSINPVQIPAMLLDECYDFADKNELQSIYREYCDITKNARTLEYSRGLKELLELDQFIEEQTDEEILSDTGHLVTHVATIEKKVWGRIKKANAEVDILNYWHEVDSDPKKFMSIHWAQMISERLKTSVIYTKENEIKIGAKLKPD